MKIHSQELSKEEGFRRWTLTMDEDEALRFCVEVVMCTCRLPRDEASIFVSMWFAAKISEKGGEREEDLTNKIISQTVLFNLLLAMAEAGPPLNYVEKKEVKQDDDKTTT